MTATRIESPEITGAWDCPTPGCGNRTHFTGIDANGFGGPDFCECDGDDYPYGTTEETKWERQTPAHYIDGHAPDCPLLQPVELVQPFAVLYGEGGTWEPGDLDFDRFEGGGSGAEIGSYTKIVCDECGNTLWQEEG